MWSRRRALGIAIYIGVNVGLTIDSLHQLPLDPDWALWAALPEGLATGRIYELETEAPFVWSPFMAWVMSSVVTHVGFVVWAAVHVLAVFALRRPLLILLTLTSWGFWLDVAGGNTFTFVFVAGALAIRGNSAASVAYLGLLLLMPRPIQIPLAAWILATRSETRLPFVAMGLIHLGAVLASGYAPDWIAAMWAYGQSHQYDLGPGRFIGSWWLLIGIPLALWLGIRRYPGLAGLVMSPYLLPQYLLMPLLDMERGRMRSIVSAAVPSRTRFRRTAVAP